jgi:hypothetical protein
MYLYESVNRAALALETVAVESAPHPHAVRCTPDINAVVKTACRSPKPSERGPIQALRVGLANA